MFAWNTITQTFRGSRWPVIAMDMLVLCLSLAAGAVLVLYHGFPGPNPPVDRDMLEWAGGIIVFFYVADRMGRLAMARRRREYFRENWADYALIALAALVLMIGWRFYGNIISAGALYLIITQAYMLISLILQALSVNLRVAGKISSPILLLFASFAALCFAGAGLLMLPASIAGNYATWHFPEALFTAVSAACVTGLTVTETGSRFTPFGQAVILILIQLGGLGIMLFGTILAMLAGKRMSLRGADNLNQMLGAEGVGQVARVGAFIIGVTLAIEAVGAVLMYPMFAAPQGAPGMEQTPGPARAAWDSIFHSVSAFCNAGFSTYDDGIMTGARGSRVVWSEALRDHWQVLGVLAPLIVLGGLGFPVLQDVGRYFKSLASRCIHSLRTKTVGNSADLSRPGLSLHSNLAIMTSLILIVLGAVVFMLVEPGRTRPRTSEGNMRPDPQTAWMQMSGGERLQAAYFQSVSARTAGFNTIDCSALSNGSKLWMCFLMVIGACPAGTGGGIKTVTFAILMLMIWSALRGRNEVEAYKRAIPQDAIRHATVLGLVYLLTAGIVTMVMCTIMSKDSLIDVLFESCSALGTVGLSTGISMRLEMAGEFVLTAAMFLGRIGPMALVLAIAGQAAKAKYEYPCQNVIIG
ncbi:MAG: hypothetical protein HZA50_07915 [Planctomycetes bacterium]|nr:hypothetical protein [Planctomycetota bacterium]